MKFVATPLAGAFLIELQPIEDERGFFARSFCADEFKKHGLDDRVAQCNVSFNRQAGTLRGMHYQVAPHEEAKLVRCTAGAVFDVIIDLRYGSPTRYQWVASELSARNRRAMFVPAGFAHGFQTLEDDSEVLYLMSEFYHPESARGLRWDDPRIGIEWPRSDPVLSDKDRSFPLIGDGER